MRMYLLSSKHVGYSMIFHVSHPTENLLHGAKHFSQTPKALRDFFTVFFDPALKAVYTANTFLPQGNEQKLWVMPMMHILSARATVK